MEFLVKQFAVPNERPPKDFTFYLRRLGLDSLNDDQLGPFEQLLTERPLTVADMLAAQMSGLYGANQFNRDAILDTACECTLDMLRDRGFEWRTGLRADPMPCEEDNVIIVTGNQDKDQCRRRVEAAVGYAVDVLQAGYRLAVCFSGRYPKNRATVGMYEASEMQERFDALISRRQVSARKMRELYEPVLEDGSTRTHENVANSLQLLSAHICRPCSVALASSSYHIPRLLTEFEKRIQDGYPNNQIRSLVLIGAEGFTPTGMKREPLYFKLLIFEMYRYLIESGRVQEFIRHARSYRPSRALC